MYRPPARMSAQPADAAPAHEAVEDAPHMFVPPMGFMPPRDPILPELYRMVDVQSRQIGQMGRQLQALTHVMCNGVSPEETRALQAELEEARQANRALQAELEEARQTRLDEAQQAELDEALQVQLHEAVQADLNEALQAELDEALYANLVLEAELEEHRHVKLELVLVKENHKDEIAKARRANEALQARLDNEVPNTVMVEVAHEEEIASLKQAHAKELEELQEKLVGAHAIEVTVLEDKVKALSAEVQRLKAAPAKAQKQKQDPFELDKLAQIEKELIRERQMKDAQGKGSRLLSTFKLTEDLEEDHVADIADQAAKFKKKSAPRE